MTNNIGCQPQEGGGVWYEIGMGKHEVDCCFLFILVVFFFFSTFAYVRMKKENLYFVARRTYEEHGCICVYARIFSDDSPQHVFPKAIRNYWQKSLDESTFRLLALNKDPWKRVKAVTCVRV
eukprot:PhF_6_TR39555/c0_g1_i2/m.58652